MSLNIEESKEFMKEHLTRMVMLKDTIKKFVSNKDEYIIENTNFVTD
jgi:hypothetical protein